MKTSICTRFISVVAGAVFFISCGTGVAYNHFLPAEAAWMPYDTTAVAGYFHDENGNVFPLQLLSRYFDHQVISSDDKDVLYNHHGYAQLQLDTTHVVVELFKQERGHEFNTPPRNFWCNVQASDFILPEINDLELYNYRDSIHLGSQVYYNIISWSRDTISLPQGACWKICYSKDRGLLRADFRNGHYYEIQ